MIQVCVLGEPGNEAMFDLTTRIILQLKYCQCLEIPVKQEIQPYNTEHVPQKQRMLQYINNSCVRWYNINEAVNTVDRFTGYQCSEHHPGLSVHP